MKNKPYYEKKGLESEFKRHTKYMENISFYSGKIKNSRKSFYPTNQSESFQKLPEINESPRKMSRSPKNHQNGIMREKSVKLRSSMNDFYSTSKLPPKVPRHNLLIESPKKF